MHIHTKLDRVTLLILAALGLPLACAVGPGGIDGTGSETGGGPGDGDGDGDATSGTSTSTSTSTTGETEDTGETDSTGETGETGEDPYVCEDPEPILQPDSGAPTGFVRCADGFVHRVEAVECTNPQAPDSPSCGEFGGLCTSAADCPNGPNPSCSEGGFGGCECNYGCANDGDCDEGFVCACAGVIGDRAQCVPANCDSGSACDGGLCGLSETEGCCGNSHQIACADPLAACHVDADCSEDLCEANWPDGGTVMHQCSFDGEAWGCAAPGWCNCDCGRPFLVDGEARVAPLAARADWAASSSALRPVADPETRAALARYWAEVGQFEHASIASFARFALQLLALGAPPALVADTQAAAADEIVHAQLAFGLASAYAEAPIGPGPLAIETCLERMDRRAIVEGLIVEACVGETLAALEAQEAAERAGDPELARILGQIATDELRHAQLGWRTLAWMLDDARERGEADLREFVAQTFAEVLAAATHESAADGSIGRGPKLREHGVLDDALRAAVRRAGVAAVIRPCAAALTRSEAPVATASVEAWT